MGPDLALRAVNRQTIVCQALVDLSHALSSAPDQLDLSDLPGSELDVSR